MKRILVVDDDQKILDFVQLHLKKEGYDVVGSSDGRDALKKMAEVSIDLAVVDVMMPFMDGFSLTKEIRKKYDIPIIILTAKGQINDKEEGFKAGTDDYLVKPFEPQELIFRIEALLRRYGQENDKAIRIGEIFIDPVSYSIKIKEKTFKLPLKEFELLHLLAEHQGQVFSRTQLIDQVWGIDYEGDTRTVDVHIKRLRARFKSVTNAFSIQTLRGVGYFLEVEDE
jgi:two-component system OmpR family response regulator